MRWSAALIVLSLVLTACGGAAAPTGKPAAPATATAPAAGKTLTIAITQDPPGFNPVTATNSYSAVVIQLLFDPLVWQGVDQSFHPLLASSWDVSPDSRTFTFHLNPAAKWSDGKPVTAADVAYTIDLNTNPAIPASHGTFMSFLLGTDAQGHSTDPSQPLAGVKVVDDHTVQLITKQPTDPHVILGDLGTGIYILPQHALQGIAASEFAKAPFFQAPNVTDGAFQWVKYVTDQYVQLKANPGYYMGAPKLDEVLFRVVPPTSLLPELRDGEVDTTAGGGNANIPLQDWPTIAGLANLKQAPVPGIGLELMELNTAHAYFASASVRQAITMAIDRQSLVQNLLKGQGTVAAGPVSPLYTLWADTALTPLPFDAQRAKQVLSAASFPFSHPLLLIMPSGNQSSIQAASLIQQNLAAIGLTVQIEQLDTSAFVQRFHTGQYDLSLVGATLGSDPSALAAFFGCKGTFNFNSFCDPKLDSLFQAGAATPDYNQRRSIYDQVQQEMQAQSPWVFLYWANDLLAYNVRINAAAEPTALGMLQPWLWDVK
ncbi:MAG TPA: ABC transporter substrate-binding protein [Bacillota bacterium]|nr:ABC transporter substrate-binding protein [Bacillota bacterium]